MSLKQFPDDQDRTAPKSSAKPLSPIGVEESFSQFVRHFGGELVGELMPKNKDLPLNADYFFRKDVVIAELKCFQKDLFSNSSDVERILQIIKRHADDGSVSGHTGLRWALGQEKIPREYYRDMLRLARRTIEAAIRKAKEQIQYTKDYLRVPQANGLLLLANDGNFFLQSHEFFGLTCRIMQERFLRSSVDGFVYFTVNMPARLPEHEREMLIWAPAYRSENNKALGTFVDELGAEWWAFYRRKIGEEGAPIRRIENGGEAIEVLKSMKFIREQRHKRR